MSANSYVCYMHVVRALPSEALTAIRDLTSDITTATPEPYLLLKEALLSRFTSSPLQMCFRLLDMSPLGDRRPSALFADMQSLLPRDANVLFNALFLRCLPEQMRITHTDRGELPPGELAAAADLLQHSMPLTVAAVQSAAHAGIAADASAPPVVNAINPHCRRFSPSPNAFRRQPSTPHHRNGSPGRRRSRHPLLSSAFTITILDVRRVSANHPVNGRETSKGPGGSPRQLLPHRGPAHLHQGHHQQRALPR
jgi:hypothetical protein